MAEGGDPGSISAEIAPGEPGQETQPALEPAPKPTRLGIDKGEEFLFDAIKKSNEGHDKSSLPDSPETEPGGRARDPNTGRFLPTKAEIEAASAEPQPAEPEGVAPKTVEPKTTSAKIRLGDREFESPDQAAELIKNTEWHFGRATESANAWKAEAERLRAQLANPQSAQTPAPQEAKSSPLGIDEETAQAVWEEAQKAGRPDLYMRWVAEEQAKQYDAKLQALKAEFAAPIQQQAQQAQLEQTVTQAWNGLDQYTLADGSKAFPEIHDKVAAAEIAQHWLALGLPPEAMVTPAAMVSAIATYRMFKQATQPKPQTPSAYPSPPSDARNVIGGAEPPTAAMRGDESMPAEVRRLVNGLNQAKNVSVRSNGQVFDLGFSR